MAANANVPVKIGKYDVVDVIGRGGMGIVYKAIDPHLDRPVAIKMVTSGFSDHPDHLKRFFREAQSLGSLQHPNIVTVYDLGDYSGNPYLVMQYLEGEPLDSVLLNRRPLSLLEKLNIMIQVCQGLSYAHRRGVVHRDIKPANIMLSKDGGVKIFDFGIAYVGDRNVTTTGQIVGTLSYMSPEQVNAKPIDARTDLFSAGVVLYQLFTGHLPFDGETTATTLLKILHDPPPPLGKFLVSYPPELEQILMRALAKEADDRYGSAEEFALDLARLQGQLKQDSINQEMSQVAVLIESGEVDKAQESLLRVLKIDQHNTDANRQLRELQQKIKKDEISGRVRKLKEEAENAVAHEQFDMASDCLDRALQLDRNNTELQGLHEWIRAAATRAEKLRNALKIAESAHIEGRLDTAKRAVESALEMAPSDMQAKALYRVIQRDWTERARQKQIENHVFDARQEIASRRFTAALEILKQAQELDPKAPEVQALIESATAGREQERRRQEIETATSEVEDALNRDDYRGACERASEALRRFPDDRTLLKLQILAERQRQTEERKQFIDEQLSHARKLLQESRHEELLKVLESAIAKTGPEPRLQSLLAIVRENVERERFDSRKADCVRKAKEFLRNQVPDDAVRVLESIATEVPDDAEIRDLLERAQTEKAALVRNAIWRSQQESVLDLRVQILQEALRKTPHEPDLEKQLHGMQDLETLIAATAKDARNLEDAHEYDAALVKWEALRSAYRHYPDLDKNIERVKKLCEDARGDARANWIEKIKSALIAGDFSTAGSLVTKASEEFPWDPEVMDLQQKAETGLKLRGKAEKVLSEGRMLLESQHWEQGADAVMKAARMASEDRVMREQAASALLRASGAAMERDWRAAEGLLRRLVELDPGSAAGSDLQKKLQERKREESIRAALDAAKAAHAKGDLEGALRELAPALSLYPDDQRLRGLADLVREQAQRDREKTRLDQARKEREAYVQDAIARAQRGPDLEARIKVLEDALRKEPDETRLEQQLRASQDLLRRVSSLVGEAREMERTQKYDKAVEKWVAVRSLHPEYPELDSILKDATARQQQALSESRERWVGMIRKEVVAARYAEAADLLSDAKRELPGDRALSELENDIRLALEGRAKAEKALGLAAKAISKRQWKKGAGYFEAAWKAANPDPMIRDQVVAGLTEAAQEALPTDWQSAELLYQAAAEVQPGASELRALKAAIEDRRGAPASGQAEENGPRSRFVGYFQDAFRSITLSESASELRSTKPRASEGWNEGVPSSNAAAKHDLEQVQGVSSGATLAGLEAFAKKPSKLTQSLAETQVFGPDTGAVLKQTQTEKHVEPVAAPAELRQEPSPTIAPATRTEFTNVAENSGTIADARSGKSAEAAPEREAILRTIEKQLAEFLGPLARIVVKRAAAQTSDVDELYTIAARSLDREEDRQRFLVSKGKLSRRDAPSKSPGGIRREEVSNTSTGGGLPPEITASAIERAAALLAPHVGPISAVMVRKAAQRADSLGTLYLLLAEHVPGSAERRRFLREAGFPEG